MSPDYRTVADLQREGFIPELRSRLPGSPPMLRVAAGGERWHLDGKPLHAGYGVDLLTIAEGVWCPSCKGEGHTSSGETCPDCEGTSRWVRPLWVRTRFEFFNAGDGTGSAYLYLNLPGLNDVPRHAVELKAGDDARLRWPDGGRR